jgi:hypothetical protein
MEHSHHPIKLQGDYCTLEPLSLTNQKDLIEAAADGNLHRLWYTFVPLPHGRGSDTTQYKYPSEPRPSGSGKVS